MEDANFLEQEDRNPATFSFGNVCTKTTQKRLDVLPADVCAGGMCEDCFQCPLMSTLHARIVPQPGTERNEVGF